MNKSTGEHHGKKSGSISKRHQFTRVFEAIWDAGTVSQRSLQLALA
jgi:hypothetical protein